MQGRRKHGADGQAIDSDCEKGIEHGERWSMVGLVRYRSRRDLLEIATNPAFRGAHQFKTAAMAQTIAVPVEPYLQLGSPRWLAAGALLAIGLLLQLVLGRRRP